MRKEIITKVCERCKKDFQANKWFYNDKVICPNYCDECGKAITAERNLQEFRQKISKLTLERRINWVSKCGVGGIFLNKSFDNFDSKAQPRAYQLLKNYNNESLVLLSPNIYGVGKTHLVCALANSLIDKTKPIIDDEKRLDYRYVDCPVLFTTEYSILDSIRATYNHTDEGYHRETEEDIYASLTFASLLIIDDVGKIQPKDYAFLQGVYYRIIDGRYVNNKPIIMTTNLDFSHLEAHIGGACADRLKAMCGENMIKMSGRSYR